MMKIKRFSEIKFKTPVIKLRNGKTVSLENMSNNERKQVLEKIEPEINDYTVYDEDDILDGELN